MIDISLQPVVSFTIIYIKNLVFIFAWAEKSFVITYYRICIIEPKYISIHEWNCSNSFTFKSETNDCWRATKLFVYYIIISKIHVDSIHVNGSTQNEYVLSGEHELLFVVICSWLNSWWTKVCSNEMTRREIEKKTSKK